MQKALSQTAVNETTEVHKETYFQVQDLRVGNSDIAIIGTQDTLWCITDASESLTFMNQAGEILDVMVENNQMQFPQPFDMITATIENNALCFDFGYKGKVRFLMYQELSRCILNSLILSVC